MLFNILSRNMCYISSSWTLCIRWLLLIGMLEHVAGNGSGAPSAACSTMSPDPTAHGASGQTSDPPVTLTLDPITNTYDPGQTITSALYI